jgi:hypothetical protein
MTHAIKGTKVTKNASNVVFVIPCFIKRINKFINGFTGRYSISETILFCLQNGEKVFATVLFKLHFKCLGLMKPAHPEEVHS